MKMDTHTTEENVISNDLHSKIAATVKGYFAKYAKGLPDYLRAENERYVTSRCLKCAGENDKQFKNANTDTEAFVLGVIFSHCISEGTRLVETPLGHIVAYPKHKTTDCTVDYPGIYVDLVGKEEQVLLACVEFAPAAGNGTEDKKGDLQTCVYGDCLSDEPTDICVHKNTDTIYND